jgi:hypothetical protein
VARIGEVRRGGADNSGCPIEGPWRAAADVGPDPGLPAAERETQRGVDRSDCNHQGLNDQSSPYVATSNVCRDAWISSMCSYAQLRKTLIAALKLSPSSVSS